MSISSQLVPANTAIVSLIVDTGPGEDQQTKCQPLLFPDPDVARESRDLENCVAVAHHAPKSLVVPAGTRAVLITVFGESLHVALDLAAPGIRFDFEPRSTCDCDANVARMRVELVAAALRQRACEVDITTQGLRLDPGRLYVLKRHFAADRAELEPRCFHLAHQHVAADGCGFDRGF